MSGVASQKIGRTGELIACKFLKSKGLSILERNYLRKWGEIDIIAKSTLADTRDVSGAEDKNVSYETLKNDEIVHFVEVKSVSYETKPDLEKYVSYETGGAEELVDTRKLGQIHKAVETWINEHSWHGMVQIDVVAVYMVAREKYAKVKYFADIEAD